MVKYSGFTVHFHGWDADLLASLDIQDSMEKILLVLTFKMLKSGLQDDYKEDCLKISLLIVEEK